MKIAFIFVLFFRAHAPHIFLNAGENQDEKSARPTLARTYANKYAYI